MNRKQRQITPNVLTKLAHLLGTEVKDRRLIIPEKFGKGYCIGFVFNEHIRIIISNYILDKDVYVKNTEINISKKMIFVKFQNVFPKAEILQQEKQSDMMPSVLIATSRANTDKVISVHSNIATINLEVDANYLNDLFIFSERSPILQSLLKNTQPLLFEQIVSSSLQKIINEILTEKVDETFELFFLRVKSEELICRLLMELEKRDEKHLYSLNSQDIQALYKVKEQILAHLETSPVIKELATSANMSTTKLKCLFKQIFGNSIFKYYQEFRMKEAARLLKEEKRSVSEVGYQMGFINLSHFARVFNEHIGMKPKQYTKS